MAGRRGAEAAQGLSPWVWSGAAAGLTGLCAALWFFARPLYFALLNPWSFQPFRFPFVDSLFYITNRQCFARGVDVYASNPCDVLNRVFSNSPFCLRLFLIPDDPALNPLMGGVLVLGFLLSLAALPPIAGRARQWRFAATLFSPAVVFAVERANLDLFIYALCTLIMVLLGGGAVRRAFAYGLTLFGFLVKFYPVMLILLALREGLGRALAIGALTLACIAAFVGVYHHELVLMAPNVPHPSPFGYDLGAVLLAEGLGLISGLNLIPILTPILAAISLLAAWRLCRAPSLARGLAGLSLREADALAVGCLLLVGCFFSGVSIGYRGMHLLFAMPGLMLLAPLAANRGLERLVRHGPLIALALLWSPVGLRLAGGLRYVPTAPAAALASLCVWLVRETLWWGMATLMLAIILRLLAEAPAARQLRRMLPGLETWLSVRPA